jgi:hypothetical protein
MGRAVFLDRDGIVNWRIVGDYVRCAEEFVLLPDFVDFLRGIKALGFLSILVTNQQGIGRDWSARTPLPHSTSICSSTCSAPSEAGWTTSSCARTWRQQQPLPQARAWNAAGGDTEMAPAPGTVLDGRR